MSRYIRLSLSVLTGVFLSLAWLGLPGWTLFIAFIPLLMLDAWFTKNKASYTSVSYWGHAFIAVLLWNALTTWWIGHATIAGAILAISANSFVMSLVLWIGHIARRIYRTELAYIALIVFWISFEYLHYTWDIEWPWLTLGNGFANNIKLVQWYEYTGILGGSFWILAVNLILFSLIQSFRTSKPTIETLKQALFLILSIAVPIIFSYNIYSNYKEKTDPVEVVIVQPNIDPYQEQFDFESEKEKLNLFTALAGSHISDSTRLVIGPETLFESWPKWDNERLELNPLFRQLHRWISNYRNTELIFGASTHKIYENEESASPTAREINRILYDVYNTAIFIGADGSTQLYHKSILVPGVEKMPFRKYLSFLNDLVFDLGGTTGSLGMNGNRANLILKDNLQAATVICYESVFGGYLTQFIREGAKMIVVITNDGWWSNTAGYKQHFSFSRLRAIETRRSVARAANTGISGIINQRGEVVYATGWWTATAIKGDVNLNSDQTFYVRYGEYIARVSMFTSIMLLLFLFVKNFITSRHNLSFESRG